MTMVSNNEPADFHMTTYDRRKCHIGIVHIGYGAFHRAHQAVYIDDFMQKTGDLRWGIAAVNLRESESVAFKTSQETANGYLLKTTSPTGACALRLVRSHVLYLDWPNDKEKAEHIIAEKNVHAVTITVTESGYYLKDDFTLNLDDPVISQEISGNTFTSIYGYLLVALKQRFHAGGWPLNILCCDNIRSNGHMLERNLKHYLELKNEQKLLSWVDQNISFPCSMVDRITPRAHDRLRQEIETQFGPNNYDPIHGESYIQWVLAHNFIAPMPDLSKVGVQIVDDVDPYEEAKIRILNGGHTGLCYLGALSGHTTYDQAFLEPKLRKFFDDYETNEVLPGLDMELPLDKYAYLELIVSRFSNKAIADQLERICMDGVSKIPLFIRPTLESCLKQGIKPVFGYQVIASWYIYARHHAAGHMAVPYHEPYWHLLEPLLKQGKIHLFTQSRVLWADLPEIYPDFASDLQQAITEMEKQWPA